jgi:hypothetical protein
MSIKNFLEILKNLLSIEHSTMWDWLQDVIDRVTLLKAENSEIEWLKSEIAILKTSIEQLELRLVPIE